jgi:hypothetical protein
MLGAGHRNFGWLFAEVSEQGLGLRSEPVRMIQFDDSKQLVPRDSGAGPARSETSIGRFDEPQE